MQKLCNQSRNVPAGRWNVTWLRFASANPRAALHAKICNQSRNVPVGRWKKGPEVQNASTHIGSEVIMQVAASEVGKSAIVNVGPAALHAKVCNQSRNVPAGRWKKAPEVQNASAHPASLVAVNLAILEVSRSFDVGPAALHAKVCNPSCNVPAGRWKKGLEGSKCEHAHREPRYRGCCSR